ncbi:MAG: prepilin-type N-terminal cleavage/methylation domain-containing protein [Gemmatimonadetes bacterium]|nr:prepilin-type N-terminal cleavage/methylation domain-containing protein [Gemmatimonadota bacterium]
METGIGVALMRGISIKDLSGMHRRTHPRGFTIIELLAVVVILGVLAGFAVPKLRETTEQARMARAIGDIRGSRRISWPSRPRPTPCRVRWPRSGAPGCSIPGAVPTSTIRSRPRATARRHLPAPDGIGSWCRSIPPSTSTARARTAPRCRRSPAPAAMTSSVATTAASSASARGSRP